MTPSHPLRAAEAALDAPVVPLEAARANGAPPPWSGGDDAERELFRRLAAVVRGAVPASPCVAVTSTVAGEGVSWVASRLACAFAEEPGPVFLLDLDPVAPCQVARLAAGLACPIAAGGALRLESHRTAWPNLTVVVPERGADLPPEVLVGRLRDVLPALRESGALVLDCGSMRNSGVVLHLRGTVDGALYVVEAERERRQVIARSQEALHHGGVPMLGVVLNKRRHYIPDAVYRRF